MNLIYNFFNASDRFFVNANVTKSCLTHSMNETHLRKSWIHVLRRLWKQMSQDIIETSVHPATIFSKSIQSVRFYSDTKTKHLTVNSRRPFCYGPIMIIFAHFINNLLHNGLKYTLCSNSCFSFVSRKFIFDENNNRCSIDLPLLSCCSDFLYTWSKFLLSDPSHSLLQF